MSSTPFYDNTWRARFYSSGAITWILVFSFMTIDRFLVIVAIVMPWLPSRVCSTPIVLTLNEIMKFSVFYNGCFKIEQSVCVGMNFQSTYSKFSLFVVFSVYVTGKV